MFEFISSGNGLIEKIDSHTEHLIELLGRIYHCFTEGYPAEKYEYIINELADYVFCQFACEEQWMSITMYDEISVHKEEHVVFITDITEIRLRLSKDEGRLTLDDLLILIQRFTQHILVTDKKYRQFISDNPTAGIKLSEYALFSSLKKLESLIVSDKKTTEGLRPTLMTVTNDHF